MGWKWRPLPPPHRGFFTNPWRERRARRIVDSDWARRLASAGPIDRCPGEPGLFVSLTSHAARFRTLALTLKSLLLQTVRPEAILLWIGDRDFPALPDEVRALEAFGLSIRACEDHGPHTKYVHALREFPQARVAICDDDNYYRPAWLAELVAADRPGEIPCLRVHRITLDKRGLPERYALWRHESRLRDASPLDFPTGVGGALLRAERFDPRLFDMGLARKLCPSNDDLWLYATARLAGTRFRLAGSYDPPIEWRRSQRAALWWINVAGRANDRNMAALIAHFGAERLFGRPATPALAGWRFSRGTAA